jgi:uncharacterized protein YciI
MPSDLGEASPNDSRGTPVHFVIHAVDRPVALNVRAKHYGAHRIHLDRTGDHGVMVITAGTLVAEDGETPVAARSFSKLRAAPQSRPSRAAIRSTSRACGRRWMCITTTGSVARGHVEIVTRHPEVS